MQDLLSFEDLDASPNNIVVDSYSKMEYDIRIANQKIQKLEEQVNGLAAKLDTLCDEHTKRKTLAIDIYTFYKSTELFKPGFISLNFSLEMIFKKYFGFTFDKDVHTDTSVEEVYNSCNERVAYIKSLEQRVNGCVR